ncbi:MAG: hypothetical protein AMXMBFR74_12410 [Parvibaculum sp.]
MHREVDIVLSRLASGDAGERLAEEIVHDLFANLLALGFRLLPRFVGECDGEDALAALEEEAISPDPSRQDIFDQKMHMPGYQRPLLTYPLPGFGQVEHNEFAHKRGAVPPLPEQLCKTVVDRLARRCRRLPPEDHPLKQCTPHGTPRSLPSAPRPDEDGEKTFPLQIGF